jgi:diacylglycerol kinase (ATP)
LFQVPKWVHPGFRLDLNPPGSKLSRVRACVIFNPSAKGQKAERFRRTLDLIGREAVLKQTDAPGSARRLATTAIAEGFDTLIAAGGDGTVNEVLNGIGDAPDGFPRARLGVLPLGTVNVFARELGLPLNPEAAWTALRHGKELRLDLPFVESLSAPPERIYFAQLAGAGLDSRAIELVEWPLKKKIGPLAYIVAGLKAMRESHPKIQATANQRTITGELILVGNGQRYGGSYRIFPNADFGDGKLDVCIFPKVNWWRLCRCGFSLVFRRKLPEAMVVRFQAAEFSITTTCPLHVEVDGELSRPLPARFGLRPAALRVLGP